MQKYFLPSLFVLIDLYILKPYGPPAFTLRIKPDHERMLSPEQPYREANIVSPGTSRYADVRRSPPLPNPCQRDPRFHLPGLALFGGRENEAYRCANRVFSCAMEERIGVR